jgi:tripartite-type tricarboxylate transporter receptor subunit TctC
MLTRRRLIALSAAHAFAPSLLVSAPRAEPAFPHKPVRVIVPVAAEGPTDLVARMLADKLSKMWGQQVFVENKGAGTNIGQRIRRASRSGRLHPPIRDIVTGGERQPVSLTEL